MKFQHLTKTILVFCILLSLPSKGESQTEKKRPKEYFLNVNVVPLGPVQLATFKTVKKSEDKIKEETAESLRGAKEKGKKAGPPVQGGRLVVKEIPKDERPPESIYYKLGRDYYRISCNLNAVGKPTRIRVKTSILKFYTRGENTADGKPSYKLMFDHEWSPEQQSILFTITKPLKTKKWTDYVVKSYDITEDKINNAKLAILYAGQQGSVKLATKEGAKILRPHGVSFHDSDKVMALTIAAMNPDRKMPSYKRYFQVKNKQLSLLFVYPVTTSEDYHQIKYIHSRINPKLFKMATPVE